MKEWLLSLTNSTLKSVTFIFVPGHAGIKRNERADRQASRASAQTGAAMDRSDILNALREIGCSSDSVQYGVSESMDRLQDLLIKQVFSYREHHTGVSRRMINQHMTGTISIYTVRNLIQE
jgi:hypothetical protein